MRFVFVAILTCLGFLLPETARADLLVSSLATHSINRYDEATGEFIEAFVAGQAGNESGPLVYPGALAFGPDGNLYVASRGNKSILRYEWPTGNFLGSFTLGGNLGTIHDMKFGPNGDLYVSSDELIKRFNGASGEFIEDLISETQKIDRITFGPNGNLYGTSGSAVKEYSAATGEFIGNFVTGAKSGLEFGTGDDLFVFGGNSTVNRYDGGDGSFLQIFAFNTPSDGALHFGPDGNLYLAFTGPMSVLQYDGTTGALIGTFLSTGPGEETISIPFDFAWSPRGGPVLGDANDDGVLNNADINFFVLALVNLWAYELVFPDVDVTVQLDMNGDGAFNNSDINGMVAALTGGN